MRFSRRPRRARAFIGGERATESTASSGGPRALDRGSTSALPTTTPSAKRADLARACSGVETPKPTQTGSGHAPARGATLASRSAASAARAPVTPVSDTK